MVFSLVAQPTPELETFQAKCFRVARPRGWRVAENSTHAVMLVAPDDTAWTILTGETGLPWWLNPWQFVHDELSAMRPNQLWVGAPKAVQACLGFPSGWEFECQYTQNGIAWRGVVKCSVASSNDHCTMVVTGAFAHDHLWAEYADWLPQVADQVSSSEHRALETRPLQAPDHPCLAAKRDHLMLSAC